MLDQITHAKLLQSQIAVMQEQLSKFTTPALYDTSKLTQLYQRVNDIPGIDKKELRHHFVFIAVYLYSPSALLGYSIKAGLCQQIGEVIGRCRQDVSEIFYEAKLRYERVQPFQETTHKIFAQIICKELQISPSLLLGV